MHKENLLKLFSEIGFSPKKKLGQNFLIDPNMLKFIVKTAEILPTDNILEVGPGIGFLTKYLIQEAKKVVAVELDKKLFSYITTHLNANNLTLVHADILKVDISKLFEGCDFRIISNMPYAISTPFLMKLITTNTIPSSMLLLLQNECAGRLIAKPNTPQYNAVTVLAQVFFKIRKIRTIPPEVFFPKPEVLSTLVKFEKISHPLPASVDLTTFISVVKCAFSRKRKTLLNNLSLHFNKEKIINFMSCNNLELNCRAEELPPHIFIEITKTLL